MPVFASSPLSACWNYGAFDTGATVLRWADAAPVTILKKTDTVRTVNGYTDSVYRVRLGGKETTLWGGELANAALPLAGSGQTLLVRVVGTGAGKLRQGEARVFPGGAPVRFAPIEVQESDRFGYSLSVRATDGRGLRGVDHVLRLKFTYEACDYPNGEVILLQRGTRLMAGMRALSSGNETGSAVYQLIFPDDKGGRAGVVRQRTTLTELTESGKVRRQRTRVETYRWTGDRMIK